MNKNSIFASAALACGLAFATPASATLTLQPGLVGGSGDVDNVIFNACGTASSGTTVQGCLNTSHTTLVNFTSNETLNISGGGQASIKAQDGTFNTITIELANPTLGFDKLQFNLDATADGFANFTAVDQFGTSFNFNNIALDGTGQNFFTLGSLDGQVAVRFTLVSTVGISLISELEQVRLGPATITPTPVPAPAGLALMGLGLLGLGMVRRKAA
ncbi:PEP-CTERM sorting domain-containing protein [Sabulicella glaciei]|uniref:PEP-CTERM sorting domain-containing protein n=1 Tax=Sabulicella glaciei TaxID=2984948 RepID=A0ABT3P1I2_9PROT|nr:PEP-CTERM sorting domain-containing protein [Roseococcus sp. MDT2-1-1]MCW8088270.1 PEP-CTERM sorting domain-containing protein [Roseococcus sp. MDT2-1-1]